MELLEIPNVFIAEISAVINFQLLEQKFMFRGVVRFVIRRNLAQSCLLMTLALCYSLLLDLSSPFSGCQTGGRNHVG